MEVERRRVQERHSTLQEEGNNMTLRDTVRKRKERQAINLRSRSGSEEERQSI